MVSGVPRLVPDLSAPHATGYSTTAHAALAAGRRYVIDLCNLTQAELYCSLSAAMVLCTQTGTTDVLGLWAGHLYLVH